MVYYKCSRCNKVFKQKGHYTRHINRKNKCLEIASKKNEEKPKLTESSSTGALAPKLEPLEPIESLKCKYCLKIFSKTFNLKRHYDRCKEKKKVKEDELKEEMFKLLLDKMNNQEKQNKEYQEQIKILQNKIENISTGTVNYNYNTQNIQQNTIQVLAYDKTDISHLKDKDYNKVLKRGNFCVPNLVDAIHFNPNKPENHNIYIPNMKTGFIMCWNGKSWDIRNREDVIDDIYDDKSNLLIDKLDEWEEIGYKLDPIIMTKFKRFLGKMDDDIVKNKVKEEIRFLLYNKRNIISKTK